MAGFMDLVHHFVLLGISDQAQRQRINEQLIGPPRAGGVTRYGDAAPPAWWKGDANAARSSILAMSMMRR